MLGNDHIRLSPEKKNCARTCYWEVFFIIGVLFFPGGNIFVVLRNYCKAVPVSGFSVLSDP